MASRFSKASLLALLLLLPCQAAWAQSNNSASGDGSIFSDAGQGGKWIEKFFPYNNPHLDNVYVAIGKMLAVYNTGILVLASMLALWAIVSFILDSAHTGTIGGGRHNVLYGPLRLVIALALLVPLNTGYNSAQIIALQLARSGSGLANSVWKKFSPATTTFDFSRSSFAANNIDGFLQQALINEACLAAVQLDDGNGDPQGSIKMQAIYSGAAHAAEGKEFALTTSMDGSIATEADMTGQTAREIRIHYNRNGNDDYCGSLSLPVPVVPAGSILDPTDQTAYAAAFIAIRPELASYAQKMAAAIDQAIKAHNAPPEPAPSIDTSSLAYIPPAPAPAQPAAPSAPVPPVEVPQIELPVSAWNALITQFNTGLLTATDKLQHKYIDSEIAEDYSQNSDQDWIWAGSLFFKLTRLSHDDLKLRFGTVSANLPNPDILPAEMREDGLLASCPELRNDVFLPDYHCRREGRETILIVKTTDEILHTMQSQRGSDAMMAIDAGPGADRKADLLAGNLIQTARLDPVVSALAQNVNPSSGKQNDHFDSMFNAVNIGNALYLSSSSLFHASSLAGQNAGSGSSSLVLSLFACLILVPGFFLSVYLPLLPALRFFLGIATWLITVFEALVAMPLIALVQIRTQGDGLLSHGRQGWFLLLQMLLRPALMIFGLMAAIIIFDALYGFITWAIWSGLLHISGDAGQFGGGIEGMLELLGYLMFWSVLVYFAANLSFNAITVIPDRILVWIGAADMGGGVTVNASSSSTSQPLAVSGGASPVTALPGAPSPATLVSGSAPSPVQQITQTSGSPATQTGGDTVNVGGPNGGHFPNIAEVYVPEGPQSTTTVVNEAGAPRGISGKPKPLPRESNEYHPPVQGDNK